MKNAFRSVIALAAMLAGVAFAQAQAPKPVVVLSLPSYDDLGATIDFFGQLGGQANARKNLEGMLQMFTQGKGVQGLDKTKPMGVLITAGANNEFAPMVFLPVTSAKNILDTVAGLGVVGPAQDEGDGVYRVNAKGQDVFVREKNGWAFITQTKEAPVPDDPMQALAGLNTQYDVGVRVYVQNVPPEVRKMGMEKFRGFMEFAAQQQQQQGDPWAALSRKNMQQQMAAIERLVNEADQITIGWKLNREVKNTFVDLTFTAVPGSKLAQEMQTMSDGKTKFAGFLQPNAAGTFGVTVKNSQENIDQTISTLEQLKQRAEEAISKDTNLPDDNAKEQVKKVLGQLLDVAEKTVKTGRSDLGGVLVMEPGKFQAALGFFVAGSNDLETALKSLIELAKAEPEFNRIATVKYDLETSQGVRYHQVSVKLPEEADPSAKAVFGETVDLYLGIGPDAAYLALGKGSLDMLKACIERSTAQPDKAVPPMNISVDVAAIVKFAASVNQNNPGLMMFSQALDATPGKNHVLLSAKPIPSGVTYRFELEEGILQAAGAMRRMAAGPGGPGGPGGDAGF